jgi:hypothetical protein
MLMSQNNYAFSLSVIVESWLAQSVEHETLNLRVVGSSTTLGEVLDIEELKNLKLLVKFIWITLIHKYDENGILTHACNAQRISSPSRSPLGHLVHKFSDLATITSRSMD